MGPPPRHRNKDTNYNGDIRRQKIIDWGTENPWFTLNELSVALKYRYNMCVKYMKDFEKEGLVKIRYRDLLSSGRSPKEFRFYNQWDDILRSDHPLIQHYVKRMRKLADVYATGAVPTTDSIDDFMTNIGRVIDNLDDLRAQLVIIQSNKKLRRVKTFVKAMRSE